MATTSTDAQPMQEWLVIAPDVEGKLEERMRVRSQHFSDMMPQVDSGLWVDGGALLDHPQKSPSSALPINGSFLIGRASTREEIVERLKADVYTQAGVWDWGRVQVIPVSAELSYCMYEVS
ncbi:MAG: hypothetical protein OHK93_008289 [Ramalina farinacea]|uniref:YCII-related domain-containing protein n=1 Tax=Ramalina farinacea TaxID=258253 RepID=A0AA43QM60_9LECA|nr:hypothetical protein [Ramalina farinacea]